MPNLTRTLRRAKRLSEFCKDNPQHQEFLLAELVDLLDDVEELVNSPIIPTRIRLMLNTMKVSLKELRVLVQRRVD